MEAKTIGKFITALRKANGMTQKDLAEKLNVSDKTSSRWERDESAPDLSLIPVIAEIFDVTCDELLRGERKSPAEREAVKETAKDTEPSSDTQKEELSAKSEKQVKRLLKTSFSQFQNRTYISLGLSLLGIIVAMICNLAFLRAVLGGFLGIVFYAGSIICQFIFHNQACLRVEDAELEEEILAAFKCNVIRLTQKSIGFTVACFGFTFPLLLVDAYVGITFTSLGSILYFLTGLGIALLIYAVILYFYNNALIHNGRYPLSEKEAATYHFNHHLQGRCALVLVLLFLVTTSIRQAVTSVEDGVFPILKGTTFTDYESFVAFMEKPVNCRYSLDNNSLVIEYIDPNATVYYDKYGNEISEEEGRRGTMELNGEIVCEYIDRNESVYRISYESTPETLLPITVYTYEDMHTAQTVAKVRKLLFLPVYGMELVAVIFFYFKKKTK